MKLQRRQYQRHKDWPWPSGKQVLLRFAASHWRERNYSPEASLNKKKSYLQVSAGRDSGLCLCENLASPKRMASVSSRNPNTKTRYNGSEIWTWNSTPPCSRSIREWKICWSFPNPIWRIWEWKSRVIERLWWPVSRFYELNITVSKIESWIGHALSYFRLHAPAY